MEQTKISFVFLFILFYTPQGKFVAYAKRATPHKADNIILKILSQGKKIVDCDTIPTEKMSRTKFLESRKLFLGEARQKNVDKRKNNSFLDLSLLVTFKPTSTTTTEGGCYDYDRDVPESMRAKMQARMHPGQRPSVGLQSL